MSSPAKSFEVQFSHTRISPKFAKALADCQASIGNIVTDAKNPHFRNNFISLTKAVDTILPKFREHGMVVQQFVSGDYTSIGVAASGDQNQVAVGMVTVDSLIIFQETGEILQASAACPVPADAQKAMGGVKYLRRYSLVTLAGSADIDDDGEQAVGRDTKPQPRKMFGQK